MPDWPAVWYDAAQMEIGRWFAENWYPVIESVGIIGGLLFTSFSLRSETRTRRIANLLIITQNHREIWTELYRRPGLSRVLNPVVDVHRQPVTTEEELFINFLVLHLSSTYHAMKDDVFVKPEGLRRDINRFFSLPIPAAVWEKIKSMQDDEFVSYVEACRNWK